MVLNNGKVIKVNNIENNILSSLMNKTNGKVYLNIDNKKKVMIVSLLRILL